MRARRQPLILTAGIVCRLALASTTFEPTPDLSAEHYPPYRVPGKRWKTTADVLLPLQKRPPVPPNLPHENEIFVYRDDDVGNKTILEYGFQPPSAEMRIERLTAFGTAGERVTTWFKVLPQADMAVPSLRLDPIHSESGAVLDSDAVRIYRLRRWLQQYGSNKYYISPQFFEPMDRWVRRANERGYPIWYEWRARPTLFDTSTLRWIEVDSARMRRLNPEAFMIAVRIPEDTRPGLYSSRLAIESDGKKLAELPFSVRVLDFRLQVLPVNVKGWCMWGWPSDLQWRMDRVSDAEMDRMLAAIHEAGIESLNIGNRWVKDRAYKPRIEHGRIVDFESPDLDRWLAAIERTGFKGFLILDVGNALEYQAVGRFIGLKHESLKDAAQWPPSLRQGIVDFVKALQRKMDRFGMPCGPTSPLSVRRAGRAFETPSSIVATPAHWKNCLPNGQSPAPAESPPWPPTCKSNGAKCLAAFRVPHARPNCTRSAGGSPGTSTDS